MSDRCIYYAGDDGPVHELSKNCPCLPRVDTQVDEHGTAHEIIIHNAWEDRYR